MTDSTAESFLTIAASLLTYYSGEGDNSPHIALLDNWLEIYPPDWVRLALIEALYRGRYKTISVGSLLADWQRRGQPIYHFNREFEALICHNFPKIWFGQDPNPSANQSSVSLPPPAQHCQPSMTITPPICASNDVSSSLSTSTADTQAWSSGLEFPLDVKNSAHLVRAYPETDQPWEQATSTPPLRDMLPWAEPEDTGLFFEDPPARVESQLECQRQAVAPIHRFTPDRTSSDHYQKLMAMVSARSQLNDQQATPINSVAS